VFYESKKNIATKKYMSEHNLPAYQPKSDIPRPGLSTVNGQRSIANSQKSTVSSHPQRPNVSMVNSQ
jgi:hypothetical protein